MKTATPVAIVAAALMLTASFPKIGCGTLAWLALVPLLVTLPGRTPAARFRLGMIFGLLHASSLLYWLVGTMHTYGGLPYLLSIPVLFLFAAYLSLFWGAFTAFAGIFLERPFWSCIFSPMAAVSLEWLRSFLFTGFPWGYLGHTQANHLWIIQIADITGVYGITFLLFMGNLSLYHLLRFLHRRSGRWQEALGSLLLFALLTGMMLGYGRLRLEDVRGAAEAAPKRQFTVVQGNIPQDIKWQPAFQQASTMKYVTLSTRTEPTDLIVWPETATPFYFGLQTDLTALVTDVARRSGTELLVGSPAYEIIAGQEHYYNSAFLVDRGGAIRDRYDKAHLVPFGEYVPLGGLLSFLGKMVQAVGDFDPGTPGRVIPASAGRLGVQICYEIVFPNLSRKMVDHDADILINITNDAWFGTSSGPYQHLVAAVFRAVENRRSLVRSANTGISAFIAPSGEILSNSPLLRPWKETRSLPLLKQTTIYTRYGDVFAIGCMIVSLIALLATRYRRR